MTASAPHGVFTNPSVCWYSGLGLRRRRGDDSPLFKAFHRSVEHVVPRSWRLCGRSLVAAGDNLVPAAQGFNTFAGSLPVFLKHQFRAALRRRLHGRIAPELTDIALAKSLLAELRHEHAIGGDLSLFSSLAWTTARPDLFDLECAHFASAGIDFRALCPA